LNIKKDIRFRVYVAFTGVCLFGVAILFKAALIQVKEGHDLKLLAKEMHTRTDTLMSERGNIYTEDGLLLCSSIPQFDIHVDFSVIQPDTFQKYVDTIAAKLSQIINDGTVDQYREKLIAGFNDTDRYFPLHKNLPYYQYLAIRSLPVFSKSKNHGGFIEDPKEKRINPYGMLAYRTIGLWRENSPTIGLEATYDSILTGVNGSRVVQKATGGVWMPVDGSEVEPQNGRDIVTTLDISIQDVAEHALMSVLQQYECLYGTCVVMEVQTGKIRGLVNLGRQTDGSYWEDLNYAMMPTEPGSTFKLVTLMSLLNDKYINIHDIVDAQGGAIHFGNRVMKDSHLGLGRITIKDAFAHSSNAAMAKLGFQYYYKEPNKYVQHLRDLHLDKRTGIDLIGERRPLVKSPESDGWSATTLPWMATGYEVLITPLHTCMVYNAVANGGKMMKPYLISAVREYGKVVKKYEPRVLVDKVGDSSTISQLQECMREVVLTGTANSIKSPYYGIAGKTGTAQVADKGIKYTDGVYQGSFVGYFPSDKPRYTIAVVIRTKPHSSAYYGGTIAAPVFRMIADKVFSAGEEGWGGALDSFSKSDNHKILAKLSTTKNYQILLGAVGKPIATDLQKNEIAQIVTDSSKQVTLKSRAVYIGRVPDVTGMGLRDAVYLLERQGMQVQVMGKGSVKAQSITPGVKAEKGQTITLQLS